MIAYLLIALFAFAALVTLTSLADSAVRARNAFQAIRSELRPTQDVALPRIPGDVVKLRNPYRAAQPVQRRPMMSPQRAAA